MIARRQIGLKVLFDIMPDAAPVTKCGDGQRVGPPVRAFSLGEIVRPAELVKVNETMGCFDNFDTCGGVNDGLQADPGEYSSIMEGPQGGHAVFRESRLGFPYAGKGRVKGGHRACERVSVGPEKVQVSKTTGAPLCEGAKAEAVKAQILECSPREAVISGVVWVCGKREKNLFLDSGLFVFFRVSLEGFQKIWSWLGARIKLLAVHAENGGDVAVFATVPTTAVGVGCQRSVFQGLASGFVNGRACHVI